MRNRLRYGKVVDRDLLLRHGEEVHPGLDSVVYLREEPPSEAAVFRVVRAWEGSEEFAERWRLVDSEGRTLRTSTERTVMPEQGRLEDEVAGQRFEYADDDYAVVLEVEGAETARVGFAVRVGPSPGSL